MGSGARGCTYGKGELALALSPRKTACGLGVAEGAVPDRFSLEGPRAGRVHWAEGRALHWAGYWLWQFPPAAFHCLRRWGTVRFCLTVRLERSDLSPSSLPRTLSGTGVHPTFQAPRQRRQERGQSFTFKWSIHYPDLVRVLQTSADLQKSLSFKERFTGPWGAFTGPPPPYSPSVRLDGQAPSCVLCISHPLRHCPLYPHSIPPPPPKD